MRLLLSACGKTVPHEPHQFTVYQAVTGPGFQQHCHGLAVSRDGNSESRKWTPAQIMQERPHEHVCASEGYPQHKPSLICICVTCGRRFDATAESRSRAGTEAPR